MNLILYLVIGGVVFVSCWIIYWQYIYPEKEFKDKTFIKKEKLLRFEHDNLHGVTLHLDVIAFGFLIAAITSLDNLLVFIPLIVLSIVAFAKSAMEYGRRRRIGKVLALIYMKE